MGKEHGDDVHGAAAAAAAGNTASTDDTAIQLVFSEGNGSRCKEFQTPAADADDADDAACVMRGC